LRRFFRGLSQIKTDSVFSAIREINEILSLTNEPDKLVNMVLDSLPQVLKIECCWIQTFNDRKHQHLLLAAERGFSPEMRLELTSMDMSHGFSEQIIGLGQKIVIPDLYNDGLYGFSSFKTNGFKWLVAAPLMTYRVHGILGIASRNRKLLKKETAELIMVIAGLIAHALSKAYLSLKPPAPEEPVKPPAREVGEALETPDKSTEAPPDITASGSSPGKNPIKPPDATFHSHTRRMETFRRSHR
jgi:signal transduction protein with GAF and PtsI domain